MIIDPFYVPHGSLNLHPEHWRELQKNEKLLSLVETVKGIYDQELVAVISNSFLDEIAFEATWDTELRSDLVNEGWYNGHYAGIALCILSHGAMEYVNCDERYPRQHHYDSKSKTRFWKSEHDNFPYLPENIVTVPDKNNRWGKSALKTAKPVVEVVQPQQFSLF